MIFPRRCPICDAVLPVLPEGQRQRVCPACLPELPYVKEPYCLCCGRPVKSEGTEFCADCAKRKHLFSVGRAVFTYRGRMKESMYRFKYSGRREYAVFYAEEAAFVRRRWLSLIRPDLIVPVPMYRKKQRKRGYNQAEDFAAALGKQLNVPVRSDLVCRTKNTVPMKGLSGKERRANVRQAFSLSGRNAAALKGKRVLLVDDIYTTGSTIDAVAAILMPAQPKGVFFLCVCTGKDD